MFKYHWNLMRGFPISHESRQLGKVASIFKTMKTLAVALYVAQDIKNYKTLIFASVFNK